MDAHTLNAWTRFALQKGGIGTCTALIDNPATDLEDLMFMAGEKIVVLRRLEEDGTEGSYNRKSTNLDADQWYLGYCEGVVGRFKGAHVQFQGKLKKPVLMRRSGVGAIRESTLRPMSKTDAAALHASQVPPGIPVAAVDSDDEDTSADGFQGSARSTDGSRRESRTAGGALTASHAGPLSSASAYSHLPEVSTSSSVNAPAKTTLVNQLGGKLNRLGVTTPPLSDETHARSAAALRRQDLVDSDSDESDTHLPWARASTSSNKSVDSVDNTRGLGSLGQASGSKSSGIGSSDPRKRQSLARGPLAGRVANLNMSNTLPPSPISSAESPLNGKASEAGGIPNSGSFEGVVPRIRAPGLGHTPNQSSIETMTTSESEEDVRRRDHAFSIYELYGRDSVAFPNFDFRALNNGMNGAAKTTSLGGGGHRLGSSKSSDSLGVSQSTPTSPSVLQPGDHVGAGQSGRSQMALRTPSNRRPTAAPPVGSSSIASSLRRKAEAAGDLNRAESVSNSSAFGTFDPRRRPSMGNLNGVRHPPTRGQTLPTGAEYRLSGETDTSSAIPPMPHIVSHANSERPIGSNLMARRMQESDSLRSGPTGGPRVPLQIDTNSLPPTFSKPQEHLDSPNRPFATAAAGALPSPSAMTYRPARSSSDRTSHRERIGSGQLKKNPSNPQPGAHGGMSALIVPPTQNGGLSTPSRSPSPLSVNSPVGSAGRPLSPAGPMSASPSGLSGTSPQPRSTQSPLSQQPRMLQASPVPPQNVNPANVAFDAMGFVKGSAPPFPLPREDPEDVKAWRQILSENDVAAAKKSRKVKKMVQNGIPHSMRAAVWPFLASAHLRRRPGLFEELCRVSQSAKGKKGKESLYDTIDKDLDRAYPDHKLFMGEKATGIADLEAILKAYVHYNPIVGYTQGMNLVAGFLLIQMPAEDAFWLMCGLLRDVHMEGYYSGDMKQLHVDGIVFGQLLQSMDGELAARLIELNLEPINFAPNWLLPIFARILPWQTLLRAWDMFFFEGPSWILRVALAIIRILRDPLMDKRACPGPAEALRLLLHPPQHLLTPDNVIPCALSVKLKDGEVRKLSRQASKLVRNTVLNPSTRGRPQSNNGASVARSASAPPVKRQQS